MSRDFKDYLEHVHTVPSTKKAAMMGLRYDAYGVGPSSGGGRSQQRGTDLAEPY